jgi:endonuclease/exonuclease/phosphatase family metal-dependent hydrolase
MKLKTLTWNIGGGKLLREGADPTLLASYTDEGVDEIARFLAAENPDIITLQETHRNAENDQVAYIAEKLGYAYFFHDSTSESHIDENQRLGHGIISRYPLSNHQAGFFANPHIRVEWEDGSVATSFDKGYTTCAVSLDSGPLSLTTLHLIPFRRFKIEMGSAQAVSILYNVATSLVAPHDKWLIQGDFNIDSETLEHYLPELFAKGLDEIRTTEATTPKDHKYDHILYRSMMLIGTHIDRDVQTDHFPLIAEFEV